MCITMYINIQDWLNIYWRFPHLSSPPGRMVIGHYTYQQQVEESKCGLIKVLKAQQTQPLGNRQIVSQNGMLAQPQANELMKNSICRMD